MSVPRGLLKFWVSFILLFRASNGLNLFQDLGAPASAAVWRVENSNASVSVSASVPGGIYSDLRGAGVLTEDIYHRSNDLEYRWVSKDDWTYTRSFSVSADYAARTQINLVFLGLDTAATVHLNGVELCGCDNMFRRYVFSVKNILNLNPAGQNTLTVRFRSPVHYAAERSNATFVAPACVVPEFQGECHANQMRKMQAAFSWDWGPAFPSVGIWKDVFLEAFDTMIIRDTTYHTDFMWGSGQWKVDLTVHGELPDTPTSGEGTLTLEIEADGGSTTLVSVQVSYVNEAGPKVITLSHRPNMGTVREWWPNGMGREQPLYNARVEYRSSDGDGNLVTDARTDRIGFRLLSVVQNEVVPGAPEKGLDFYFLVNSVPMFAKGSNWIPAHVLPEVGSDPKLTESLLRSAAEAGFNMLRVWGGGVYETDYFYQLCDELGILIWQDFLFACSMYPVDEPYLASVRDEVTYNVRRLQRHPSVALWGGNNENEAALRQNWYGTQSNFSAYKDQYVQLYVDTIAPVVQAEDPSRYYAFSSPSNGAKTAEEGYVSLNPSNPLYGDVHYYNYLSDAWNPQIYPRSRFCSEFGFQSLPSLRALQSVSAPGDLAQGVASEMLQQRQHHPNGYFEMQRQVETRLLPPGQYNFNTEEMLAKLIPLTQIYQAMATKTEAEHHRRWRGMLDQATGEGYTMGSLYWQLNDIWQAPTWAGIEHDGTWKVLHYFAAKFYAPLLVSPYVTPAGRLSVHAASDLLQERPGLQLEVRVHSWGQLEQLFMEAVAVDLAASSAREVYFADLDSYLGSAGCGNAVGHSSRADAPRLVCFLTFQLRDAGGARVAPDNFLLPAPLGDVVGIVKPTLTVLGTRTSASSYPERYVAAIDVDISSDAVAPFVWLDAGGLKGRFSDNGFLMTEATSIVTFLALEPVTPSELAARLTVTSLLDHWL